jgi:N-acetylmuramoyl-L-alanine amidase
LKRADLKVAMTRRDDSDTTLAGITEFANVRKAKLFYSEHHNWFRAPDVNGREWFRFPNSVGGLRLAESIERHLKIATDQPLRRWAESNFQVLRNTHMPAVLFEGGFMSNPGDLALMKDSDWLDRNALAKALGIIDYLKGV